MSNKDHLPIKYNILFFEESLEGDALHVIQTTSAPCLISIGDKFEPWNDNKLSSDKIYKVIDLIHQLFQVHDSHVVNCLNIVLTQIDHDVKNA